jgi:hypothetical protein
MAADGDMPEFVRDAVVPDAKELQVLSDYDFAIVYYNQKGEKFRKYLLVDPGNIWLSAKYFMESRDQWPKIAQSIIIRGIMSHAEKNGISALKVFNPLREIKTSLQSEGSWKLVPDRNVYDEKLYKREQDRENGLKDQQARSGGPAKIPVDKAASARVYALNVGDDSWVDRPMYEISTPELVKKACSYFEDNKHLLSIKSKCKYAAAVHAQAERLDIQVPEAVRLYGAPEVNAKLAQESLVRRARMCSGEHRKLAADLAANVGNLNASQLIECVDAFDKIAFKSAQAFGLQDAVASTSNDGSKDKVIYDSGSKKLTLRGLEHTLKNKEAKLSEVLDSKVVTSLKANPEKAFKALPNPYKKVIAGLSA